MSINGIKRPDFETGRKFVFSEAGSESVNIIQINSRAGFWCRRWSASGCYCNGQFR
jgi:hypothetical protein